MTGQLSKIRPCLPFNCFSGFQRGSPICCICFGYLLSDPLSLATISFQYDESPWEYSCPLIHRRCGTSRQDSRRSPKAEVSIRRFHLHRFAYPSPRIQSMETPLINRLPLELLVAIARSFVADPSAIFRLAMVCRCWCDVLMEAAILWTTIDCRSRSRTSILLQRSKSSPIDVTLDHTRFVAEAVSLIAENVHRIRSMNVFLLPYQLGMVHTLFNRPAPILQTIRLHIWDGSFTGFPFSPFSQDQVPALKALFLEGCQYDLSRPVQMVNKDLTTLVISTQRFYSLHDLLQYPEHFKNLEYLKICLGGVTGTVPASRVVPLPNLRALCLSISPLSILRHLSFPPSADLSIQTPSKITRGQSLSNAWVEPDLLSVFESRPIHTISVSFSKSKCAVGLSGPRLSMGLHANAATLHSNSLYFYFLDSLQSLPVAPAEVLSFFQPPRLKLPMKKLVQSFSRLLLQVPGIRRLTLDSPAALWIVQALEHVGRGTPCPKLGVLVVILREHCKTDLRDSLIALSENRSDPGCPLECYMGSYSPGSEPMSLVTQLEKIV